jgi:hypothetical protein
VSDILSPAKAIIGGALAVAALLLVFWTVGVATTHPAPAGLAAVGAGIHQTLAGLSQILSGL